MFGLGMKSVDTSEKKIEELLTRSVNETIQKNTLKELLKSGKRLRVKLGIDPTSSNIHLGRAVLLLKLRDFQELGHTISIVIGNATAVIGDTSDKESERPMLTEEQVEEYAGTYFKQIERVLDMGAVEKKYNATWLNKLTYKEIGEHADQFSVSDFIARENIKKRLDAGTRISLREVLYPLMQGYDSVEVQADVEIGGTDQRFNLLAGRKLQEHFGQKPQQVMMLSIIEGLDGRKMSSSWGNTINITDSPSDMYGKVMSLRDDFIVPYFISATRVAMSEVRQLEKDLQSNTTHPRDAKMRLASAIVSLYHSSDLALSAQNDFTETFSKGGVPADATKIEVQKGTALYDAISSTVGSKTEFRRLIHEGAVMKVGGEKITNTDEVVENDMTVKIGKRRFVAIKIK